MAESASDLVRDSKLHTEFPSGITKHVKYVSSRSARQGRLRVEESWKRQQTLGRGSFGQVWLETCISGPDQGKLRAVKEIAKGGSAIDYERELEAIAKFSHSNVRSCVSPSWFGFSPNVFIVCPLLRGIVWMVRHG
jgi:serine/threonine protein kinase